MVKRLSGLALTVSNPRDAQSAFVIRNLSYPPVVASQLGPAAHDDLVRALAGLREDERREVIAAAERAATDRKSHVVASWDSIRNAIGIVHGEPADAIADTAELYDG